MLKAIDQNGINKFAWEDKNIYDQFVCDECKEPVIFVDAIKIIKHFRHKAYSNCPYRFLGQHSETERHKEMKMIIATQFNLKPENIEKIIKQPWFYNNNNKYRIADILINNIIIECQASSTNVNSILNRTLYYTNAGYYVLWLFDKSVKISPKLNQLLKQMYFGRVYKLLNDKIFADYKEYTTDLTLKDLNFLQIKTKPNLLEGKTVNIARFTDKHISNIV